MTIVIFQRREARLRRLHSATLEFAQRLGFYDCNAFLAVIADADDRAFLTVDVNAERDDAEVEEIALWIVLAINTCGGFKAQQDQSDG